MEPLANIAMLEARLARDLQGLEKARAEELLKDASASVRSETGQTISRATSTVRLAPRHVRGRYGVTLPQWPVSAIGAVVDDFGNDVTVVWTYGDFIETLGPVTVTYTHGWLVVPDDIVALVCQVTARSLAANPDVAAVSSETLGSYSYTVGTVAAAGSAGMFADERKALAKYRRPTQPISMTGQIPEYASRYLDWR